MIYNILGSFHFVITLLVNVYEMHYQILKLNSKYFSSLSLFIGFNYHALSIL